MKRLLLIGSSAPHALESYYSDAFGKLGVEASVFDPDACLARVRESRLVNRATWSLQHLVIGRSLKQFVLTQRGIDGVLVFKGNFLSAATIKQCRARLMVPWLNLNPDSPFDAGRATSSRHVRESLPLYDTYLTWSRALVPQLEAAGCRRSAYLPFGYDPASHHPAETLDPSLAMTVSFVGSYDRQRARMLEAIADLPLRIFGNAWENLERRSPLRSRVVSAAIHEAQLRSVVTSSLASINILRPQNAGAHNMRTFEVPAMGGLMITTRSAEQNVFFPEGEGCLMYADRDELRATVQSLLDATTDAPGIKRRGLELARSHSYLARAEQLLQEFRSAKLASPGARAAEAR